MKVKMFSAVLQFLATSNWAHLKAVAFSRPFSKQNSVPSPLGGEQVRVRGEARRWVLAARPPHPVPLPQGGEGEGGRRSALRSCFSRAPGFGGPVQSSFLGTACLFLFSAVATAVEPVEGKAGYYQYPTIHGDTIVFTAEGDLWRVGTQGGVARRLTSHPGTESFARFSPDGQTLAFSAEYEGPTEVYTMPVTGGLPTRRTFMGDVMTVGWTPDGKPVFSTHRRSTLPDAQLATVDLKTDEIKFLPLSQAAEAAFDPTGKTLFFTRLPYRLDAVKRYRGGTAQTLWKFTEGATEAVPLVADFTGISRAPMWWEGRIYFVTARDGTLNLWSMNPDGGDLKQLTKHKDWEVKWPGLAGGRIVYQLGADLRLYDIANGTDVAVSITLASDFDHQREKWVKRPMDYVTAAHVSPNGDRVVLTARGQVFVAPVGPGRLVEATRKASVRYRNAKFMPDGKSLLALSDESGELEFERVPANGVGEIEALSKDGKVFRFEGEPSPDGKWIAYSDKNHELWLLNVAEKKAKRIDASVSTWDALGDLAWSRDSQWLAYVNPAENTFARIWLHRISDGAKFPLTTDRVNSYSPAWSPDGKWIYFLSERALKSAVPSPWGPRQPEPFFDKPGKIYFAALAKDQRSPFDVVDEAQGKDSAKPVEKPKPPVEPAGRGHSAAARRAPAKPPAGISVDVDGLQERLLAAPVSPGNYEGLAANEKRLFWISQETPYEGKRNLMVLDINNDNPGAKVFAEDVRGFELSGDGKKVMVRKGDTFFVEDANAGAPVRLEKKAELGGWTFALNPRDEWRQLFTEAWRLERDYFYDRNMHGTDWPGILKKYLPLVDRVTDRAELSDLIAEMVSELSALHIFVRGGDQREGPDQVRVAGLGAVLVKDTAKGGWRIEHIYRADPDYPERGSPLSKPGLNLREGDVIEQINGVATLTVADPEMLLRNQAGKQVLLRMNRVRAVGARDVVVTPLDLGREWDLRYAEWEYGRRQKVEAAGKGDLGYVHLRAMGPNDIADWARDFYPVFNRKGLIIDVRHNGGGNIDSWILEKLMRKAWFYWQGRSGQPYWNMQYAFRGHVVVICDEYTGSDGEAFTEGFKRLGLGKVIGTRTWGGEIWLSASNWLVDHGIATAAEWGVYGPEGKWLIEGHGVDPDIVVDNLPHATYKGEDAQLQRAIEHLQEAIKKEPVVVPPPPKHPDKSVK